MATVTNPLSITYGTREVGGATVYQIHGPFAFDKSYASLRVSFVVVVVGTSYEDLADKCDALEASFRSRLTAGDTLVVDLDGSATTYTVGTTLLRCAASIAKTGRADTDVGYSRGYAVKIEAELPADATLDGGLRDLEVHVALSPSRQATVTMRGAYTATTAGDAYERYAAAFDARAESYLSYVKAGATWELVNESYALDRETDDGDPTPHVLTFTRQYLELLVAQSADSLDADVIRDHRVTFTDLASYPGDGAEQLTRLHRVVAVYDCAVDIDESTDLRDVFENTVRPHVLSLFETNFTPRVFAVEEQRVGYDESGKRLSVSLVIVYLADGGEQIVEVSQSVTTRETRTIDYTPVHGSNELAAYADVGWATKERIWSRTAVVIGELPPAERLSRSSTSRSSDGSTFPSSISGVSSPDARGAGGSTAATGGIGSGVTEGWNVIASTSQSTPQWIGVPGLGQIQITTLTESVTERYHERP